MKEKKSLLLVFAIIIAVMLSQTDIVYGQQKAPDTYFYVNSKKVLLKNFKGKKVMLWLFSTWCPSCIVGFQALAKKQPELKKDNLTIIILRNYKNGGYPGPTAIEFAKKYGENLLKAKNWVFGEASNNLESIYNSKKYPDIYFLINSKGYVININGAPAATLDNILSFAKSKKKNHNLKNRFGNEKN